MTLTPLLPDVIPSACRSPIADMDWTSLPEPQATSASHALTGPASVELRPPSIRTVSAPTQSIRTLRRNTFTMDISDPLRPFTSQAMRSIASPALAGCACAQHSVISATPRAAQKMMAFQHTHEQRLSQPHHHTTFPRANLAPRALYQSPRSPQSPHTSPPQPPPQLLPPPPTASTTDATRVTDGRLLVEMLQLQDRNSGGLGVAGSATQAELAERWAQLHARCNILAQHLEGCCMRIEQLSDDKRCLERAASENVNTIRALEHRCSQRNTNALEQKNEMLQRALDKKEQRIKQLEGKLQAALAAQGDRDLQSCLADLRAAQGMTTGAAD